MAQTATITNAYVDPTKRAHLRTIGEVALNASSQVLTVPTGKIWYLVALFATLTTTATVGNRRIQLIVRNEAATDVSRIRALNDQTASTTEYYLFGTGGDVAEGVPSIHTLPVAPVWVGPGYTVRVQDVNNIDAAADDLALQLTVLEYDAQ
jgi:hypothetical protein